MALPLYERTLADCERVLGPDHPDTLASQGNLAARLPHRRSADRGTRRCSSAHSPTANGCCGPGHPLTETARENYQAAAKT